VVGCVGRIVLMPSTPPSVYPQVPLRWCGVKGSVDDVTESDTCGGISAAVAVLNTFSFACSAAEFSYTNMTGEMLILMSYNIFQPYTALWSQHNWHLSLSIWYSTNRRVGLILLTLR
jgi:hypothetical protein